MVLSNKYKRNKVTSIKGIINANKHNKAMSINGTK